MSSEGLAREQPHLESVETPALLVDRSRVEQNAARLRHWLEPHAVTLRPHVKTTKCAEATRIALGGAVGPITVSTLAEAERFFEWGFDNFVYAVGLAPAKLPRIERLVRRGADVSIILDSAAAARALIEHCRRRDVRIPALIEIDTDGRRAGVAPEEDDLLDIARALDMPGDSLLGGVLTHAGGSYGASAADEIRAWAERERRGIVTAAERLRDNGFGCPVVSVGSTPTALFGESFSGVTEVRAGVYLFFDLVMVSLGVCSIDEIALSVLGTVIGHQVGRSQLVIDTGWTALSRDLGASRLGGQESYGLVCDLEARPLDDLVVVETSQEHGIAARRDAGKLDFRRFPIGRRVRVLPNHACATAAQHDCYQVVDAAGTLHATWRRTDARQMM